jgi:hypothetical protein
MNRYHPLASPLSAAECAQLERLIARGVEGAAAGHPNNIPGWVYAGDSADHKISLLLVAFRRDEPNARSFIQSLLEQAQLLAIRLFGATTVQTRHPRGAPR